ncbi:hypothetical protein AB0K80_21380 [Streptomyces sp. NPDC052682]|uniref:hypothetical protein n=1 Tax=Streptomyces sp. NPDC052682 TaxID=3154954 RepID=UPI003428113E
MTWSAALPGAALRLLRTAAGRRALHLALLLGAVCAVGLLCGEQAQAADGVPPARTVGSAVQDSASASSADTSAASVQTPASVRASADGLRPAAEASDARLVDDRAGHGRPSSHASSVRHAAHVLDESAAAPADVLPKPPALPSAPTPTLPVGGDPSLPPLPCLPGLPADSAAPGLPTPPVLPTSPALPAPPAPPSLPAPPAHPVPAPVTQAPVIQVPVQAPHPGAVTTPPADTAASGPRTGAETSVVYGPEFARAWTDTGRHGEERRAEAGRTAPAHPAPTPAGAPDGALGHRSAADNGTSRHGDPHALTVNHLTPPRLVPGATAAREAAGTRDRCRDIPVSPA